MHENGQLTTYCGTIFRRVSKDDKYSSREDKERGFSVDIHINNMAIIYDKSCGVVLKYGDTETTDIKEYYETICNMYKEKGYNDMVNSLEMIELDRYSGILDIDEICTLVNWFCNSIGNKLMETLELSSDGLKVKIKQLQDIGW